MNFPFELASGREFDVAGFGTNAVDFLIRVPEYPSFNSKVELVDYIQAAGGEVASTMVGLQRLGAATCYVGRFGSDEAGAFGIESLAAEGIDVSMAETVPDARTQIAFILIDESTGERTVIWKRDKGLSYGADEVPVEIVSRAKILHITPHDSEACIILARAAQNAGTLVSIDLDNVFDGLEDLLPNVDVIFTSADLPKRLFKTDSLIDSLRLMRDKYCPFIVGVTLGDKGSLSLFGDAMIETPGFPVPGGCMDTTGAGDAFRAGLLFGITSGESVETSLKMANAVAALKCRAVGARTALPDITELATLLKKA